MDSFFGIGAPELVLILVIAGMVMGPERIGRTARWLGRTSAQLQSISRAFIRQLNAELDGDGETSEIKAAWNDMQEMRQQIEDLKGEFMTVTRSALNEGNGALKGIQEEIERTIAPPAILKKVPEVNENSVKSDPTPILSDQAQSSPPPIQLPNRVAVPDDPE